MPRQNLRQAWVIPSATPIRNVMGTAPSWWVEKAGKVRVPIPGPPHESHLKHIAFAKGNPSTLYGSVEQGALVKSLDGIITELETKL